MKYIPTKTGRLKLETNCLDKNKSKIFSTRINAIVISTNPIINTIQKNDLIK